ncbi:MAG: caspase family protein [Candidatus Bipolaricaulota bacterium]|nr:caspase family protein [Candidatus Bipolaricaulota bacterium]
MNLAPEASFTFGPVQPSTGQSVRFDGSPSTDRDGTISSYAWDFNGDGKTDASGMDATWTFVEAKTYTVTLSVVDSDGATGTAEQDVVVSAAPSGPPRFQQQWGLVIGIGSYEDHGISDLAYTEADAQAFYDFLTSTQGGGLQRDHVRFLLNEQATTASVKAAFRWLIGQAGAEDLVVIYFAGHGGTGEDVTVPPDEADGVDEYLITYDAQKTDLFSTAVRDDEMADWLASFRCDNVVVILDSCFAAGATRSLEQTGTRAGPGNRVFNDLVGPGRLFLAASQEAEFSYEDAALGHGVFTYYLLRGLGAMEGETAPEADADHDGRVTVEELRIYLEREVTKAQPKQHPLVTGDLTLERVALDGYGVPLAGEVTTIQGDYVIISLGSRHGIQVGNRFEIVRPYSLPDGSTAAEVRALVQVAAILEPDRAACVLVESHFPVEIGDSVRPAQ